MNERKLIGVATGSRRKSSISLDTVKQYNKKMTEQFNSGRSRISFGIIIHKYKFGLMIVKKKMLGNGAGHKENINAALSIRDESHTSEPFKDTQDAVSLIHCHKTMC